MTSTLEKLETIKAMREDMDQKTAHLIAKIQELQEDLNVISAPHREAIAKLEEEVRQDVLTQGKPFVCDFAKVTYRKAYVRSSWDTKALMGYAAAHPEIEQFKKETEVSATSSIQWKAV